jgi:hypothetical protein
MLGLIVNVNSAYTILCFILQLNDTRVRMRAAIQLVVGQHNELRNELMLKAMEHWDTLLFK